MLSALREWLRPKIVIDVKRVLSVKPGDTLVLTTPNHLSAEMRRLVGKSVNTLLQRTGAMAVMLEPGWDLSAQPMPHGVEDSNNRGGNHASADGIPLPLQPTDGGVERAP